MFSPNGSYYVDFELLSDKRWTVWHKEKKYERIVSSGGYNDASLRAVSNDGALIFSDLTIYDTQSVQVRRLSHVPLHGMVEISLCGKYFAFVSLNGHVCVYKTDSSLEYPYKQLHLEEGSALVRSIEFVARKNDTTMLFVRMIGEKKSEIFVWDFCHEQHQIVDNYLGDTFGIRRITEDYVVRGRTSPDTPFRIDRVCHRLKKIEKKWRTTFDRRLYNRCLGISDDFACLLRGGAVDFVDLQADSCVFSCTVTYSTTSVSVSNDQTVIAWSEYNRPQFVFVLTRVFRGLFALQLSLFGSSLPLYVVLLIYDWRHALLYNCRIESVERWQHSKKVGFLFGIQNSIRRIRQ